MLTKDPNERINIQQIKVCPNLACELKQHKGLFHTSNTEHNDSVNIHVKGQGKANFVEF